MPKVNYLICLRLSQRNTSSRRCNDFLNVTKYCLREKPGAQSGKQAENFASDFP